MTSDFRTHLEKTLGEIEAAGLFKRERIIATPQSARVAVNDGREVLNFCANNYLGLANHPELLRAAHAALERWGYGLSSVRFICGTQEIHKELEDRLTAFLGTEDTILYSSCFDANGGVFETLLGAYGDETSEISAIRTAIVDPGATRTQMRAKAYPGEDPASVKAPEVVAERIATLAIGGFAPGHFERVGL